MGICPSQSGQSANTHLQSQSAWVQHLAPFLTPASSHTDLGAQWCWLKWTHTEFSHWGRLHVACLHPLSEALVEVLAPLLWINFLLMGTSGHSRRWLESLLPTWGLRLNSSLFNLAGSQLLRATGEEPAVEGFLSLSISLSLVACLSAF